MKKMIQRFLHRYGYHIIKFDKNNPPWEYPSYEGMSEPGEEDRAYSGDPADVLLKNSDKNDPHSVWCYASLEDVQRNVLSTGYPAERIHFIKGKVEETIPATIPDKIAILRLDTDWYESTLHELKHLYPRLEKGGVLLIDDYGHWQGARKAVDEYIRKKDLRLLLCRTDYSGRIALKPS